jgi:O-antigen ligase
MRKDFVNKIIAGFLLGIFFSEIVSYFMLFDIKFDWIRYTGTGENVPFMNLYTQYSEVLAISMGILLYSLLYIQKQIYLKILSIVFFLSASSNIFIIQSKIGYGLYALSILTVITMIIIQDKKKIKYIPMAIIFTIVAYTAAYNLSDTFKNRTDGFINDTKIAFTQKNYQTATGIRVGYYYYTFDIIKENFLFGVGSSDHAAEFIEHINEVEHNPKNLKALKIGLNAGGFSNFDSEFLDVLVQFGFIGLLIFLNIFYQIFKYKTENYYFKVIQILTIIIFITISGVSSIFMYSKIGKIFTFLIALSLKKRV